VQQAIGVAGDEQDAVPEELARRDLVAAGDGLAHGVELVCQLLDLRVGLFEHEGGRAAQIHERDGDRQRRALVRGRGGQATVGDLLQAVGEEDAERSRRGLQDGAQPAVQGVVALLDGEVRQMADDDVGARSGDALGRAAERL